MVIVKGNYIYTTVAIPEALHYAINANWIVAGGFVVSTIFGKGDWGDIDIWSTEQWPEFVTKFKNSAYAFNNRKIQHIKAIVDSPRHLLESFDIIYSRAALYNFNYAKGTCQLIYHRDMLKITPYTILEKRISSSTYNRMIKYKFKYNIDNIEHMFAQESIDKAYTNFRDGYEILKETIEETRLSTEGTSTSAGVFAQGIIIGAVAAYGTSNTGSYTQAIPASSNPYFADYQVTSTARER
jgi:hypothetical protein